MTRRSRGSREAVRSPVSRRIIAAATVTALLWMTPANEVGAQVSSSGSLSVRQSEVSRAQAVALSALFPGLGQMVTGHPGKGTAMMVAHVAFTVGWLTSHADYNTQKELFELEEIRYLSLQDGGTHEQAEESWERLRGREDDADRSHVLRRLFGGLTMGLYGYNLIDAVFLGGVETSDSSIALTAMPVQGGQGVSLVMRFR